MSSSNSTIYVEIHTNPTRYSDLPLRMCYGRRLYFGSLFYPGSARRRWSDIHRRRQWRRIFKEFTAIEHRQLQGLSLQHRSKTRTSQSTLFTVWWKRSKYMYILMMHLFLKLDVCKCSRSLTRSPLRKKKHHWRRLHARDAPYWDRAVLMHRKQQLW